VIRADATILTVSASARGGGAEAVARTLHEHYIARGYDAWIALANADEPVEHSIEIPRDAGRSAWARALLAPAWKLAANSDSASRQVSRALRVAAEPARWMGFARGHEDFDFPWTASLPSLTPRRPDVIHLHNVHGGFFDVRALPAVSKAAPTFVTVHDMWLLTGHCAHAFECERWREGCGQCPDLNRYVPLRADGSAYNRHVKLEAMRRSRLGITAPSEWLLGLAKESGIVGHKSDARVIPNGVDTSIFFAGDTRAARMELGLPLDATIVVFAARALTTNEYKAFPVLEEALERVAGRFSAGRKLLFLGLGERAATRTVGSAELRFVPFMHDPAQMARYYRAADMYVHPARAENLPLTVIEAMACGAPVVATSVGGVPELVVEGETGLLTPLDDATALAEAIRVLADDPQRRAAFSAAGAARARERFSLEGQVDATLAWYAECREMWGLPS